MVRATPGAPHKLDLISHTVEGCDAFKNTKANNHGHCDGVTVAKSSLRRMGSIDL